MNLFCLFKSSFYVEVIQYSRESINDNITLFLGLDVFEKRQFIKEFPFSENTYFDIPRGNLSNENKERCGGSENNSNYRIIRYCDYTNHKSNIKRGLIERMNVFIQIHINHADCDIHKNRSNDWHRKELEKIKEQPSDDKSKNSSQECSHPMGCPILYIEGCTHKNSGRRQSSGDSRSNICQPKPEHFLVFIETLFCHFFCDFCRNNRLENRNNGYNKGKSKDKFERLNIGKKIESYSRKIRHIHE